MATCRNDGESQILFERGDREAVLAVISDSPSVTIEELLQHLPWMQWGHLFFILRECLEEGLVTLSQKQCQFEFRVIHALQHESGASDQARPVPSSSGD
ncbi:MAG: hypothetical protein OEM58_08630 [Nitrospirota bacterium]|nr:hypothetical protein [Nitrospirota bacterium]